MSVTNYTPGTCKYTYDKLKDVLYLVSADHLEDVHIDNGEAYISDLTELPLRINGFNIQFSEESSLDERYKFTKSITLSMHGYVNHNAFSGRYYAILESEDGTYWMVNVDFPSKVTYTFNLSNNTYQTDFTFRCQSNFPTLRLTNTFEAVEPVCLGYNVYGIEGLRLIEKNLAMLDADNKKVYTYGKEFQEVDFLGDSCTLQEVFDGERATSTIEFSIGFDVYKSSWHYNLLEFTQNLYAAIVSPKGGDNEFYVGFNFGLEPNFTVQTTSENAQSDIITIRLVEMSNRGSVAASDWSEQQRTDTRWAYVKWVGNIPCYECISIGRAKYLVQQEMIGNGVPTGNYKVLEGYEDAFPMLNIVGTFSNTEMFNNSECTGTSCKVYTSIPNTITFRSATCNTYTYSASCEWNVDGLAAYMEVTPMSGNANTLYNVEICNTLEPTGSDHSRFTITAGDNTKVVNINLTTSKGILNPEEAYIDCLKQNVVFNFDPNCPVTVTGINPNLTYQITNSQLIINVPRNYSTSGEVTHNITVMDCRGEYETVPIIQDKTYEEWLLTIGIICDGNTSYTRLARYTGTTSSNINIPTGEYKAGTLIQSGDTRCENAETRWSFNNHYYCENGNKFEAIEEEVTYDGVNWTPTGVTRLGDMVEASSAWCQIEPEYEWRISTQWVCADGSEDED